MTSTDVTRNASLEDLVAILKDQGARKLDIVTPASQVRAREGNFVVKGVDPQISADGVTDVNGAYRPTRHFDSQLATKLGIPPSFLAKLRVEAIDLYDNLVNGFLHGKQIHRAGGVIEVVRPGDERSFMGRFFTNGEGDGVARALLSDRYNVIDNYDVLLSALSGIREAGVNVEVRNCDLTDTRMYVKLHSPDVAALAPTLLKDYRNPFADPDVEAQRHHGDIERWRRIAAREGQGYERGEEPVIHAGFRLSNSEVGSGAYTLTPELLVKICKNGLVLPALSSRSVHLGTKMSEGIVQWSDDTQQKQLELIKAKTSDAVKHFLSPQFLAQQVAEIEAVAGKPVEKPVEVIKNLGKALSFSQDEQDGILDHFIRGGQRTAGGILQSITSFSQTVADADRADQLDCVAVRAMQLV